MNRYSQDDKKDIFQLQDMGTDAGIIVGAALENFLRNKFGQNNFFVEKTLRTFWNRQI